MTLCRLVTSRTSGRSAPAGKLGMRSTLALASLRARSMSVPLLNSAVTDPSPSEAEASIRFTPSSDPSSSSILRTIASSTSCGAAPGYGTRT